ncbi:dihydrofolate reductase family protein [Rhodoluna limnophila]|uniref:dihydrofolate reductase family protein n=1 Tax=Rhodoluna limnophila TaxID=232537 RepID=UPI0011074AE0|nr:dihydrofolate reductase family protein [Rhodoluna limnophila]
MIFSDHPELFELQPGWNVAMVISPNGLTADPSGSSDGISNREDRAMLGYLRSQSDLIVTTGATARAENYRSSKYAPLAIITTGSVDLSSIPAMQDSSIFSHYLITTKPNARLAKFTNVPEEHVLVVRDLQAAFLAIENLISVNPIAKILFEGGPLVTQELLRFKPETRFILTVSGVSPGAIEVAETFVQNRFGTALSDRPSISMQTTVNSYLVLP